VFAVLYGVLFLAESVTLHMLLCAGVIVCGTALSTGLLRLGRGKTRRADDGSATPARPLQPQSGLLCGPGAMTPVFCPKTDKTDKNPVPAKTGDKRYFPSNTRT
jgi:hypothetical protein